MEATYENLMAKSRELYSSGDVEGAKRLAGIAVQKREGSSEVGSLGLEENKMSRGEKIAETINSASQGFFLGAADEMDAAMRAGAQEVADVFRRPEKRRDYSERYGSYLSQFRDRQDQFQEEAPVTSAVSEIGGAVLPAFLTLGAGAPASAAATAKAAPNLLNFGGRGIVKRSLASGGAGAALGGAYGFNDGEGSFEERINNATGSALTAGGVSAAIPFVGSGVSKAANRFMSNRALNSALREAPGTADLKAAAKTADDAIAFTIPAEQVRSKAQKILNELGELGLDSPEMLARPGYAPMTPMSNSLKELVGSLDGPLDYAALKTLRRQGGNAAASSIPTDRASGMIVRQGADDLIEFAGADNKTVNSLWQKMYKSQMMDDIFDSTDGYLGGDTSAIRNQFASIMKNKKKREKFNALEQEMMKRVINGTAPEKLIRALGSGLSQYFSPILGATIGAPGGIGGMILGGVGGSALSSGARKLADNMTLKGAEKLHRLTAIDAPNIVPKINKRALRKIEALSLPGAAVGAN